MQTMHVYVFFHCELQDGLFFYTFKKFTFNSILLVWNIPLELLQLYFILIILLVNLNSTFLDYLENWFFTVWTDILHLYYISNMFLCEQIYNKKHM